MARLAVLASLLVPTAAGATTADASADGGAGDATPGGTSDAEPRREYETTVVGSRSVERTFESPRSVSVVGRDEIDDRMARTTPEALLEAPGVFVQHTNRGGGSPIIRKLHGGRILLLVDGIRINNSTTRAGPNQFLNTVDPLLVGRIEVLRGTGSAAHGSDAIGGTVNVLSGAPPVGGGGRVSGSALARAATHDASGGLGARIARAGDRLGVIAVASARRFGDLQGGPTRACSGSTAATSGTRPAPRRWRSDSGRSWERRFRRRGKLTSAAPSARPGRTSGSSRARIARCRTCAGTAIDPALRGMPARPCRSTSRTSSSIATGSCATSMTARRLGWRRSGPRSMPTRIWAASVCSRPASTHTSTTF